MKKLKTLIISLVMCLCIGVSCFGLSGCADTKTEEELSSLKTQVEQLQNENSSLKEVSAIDIARNFLALSTKMPYYLNAKFGSSDSESGEDLLGSYLESFDSWQNLDVGIVGYFFKTNVVYEVSNYYEQKYLFASDGNWQAVVIIIGDCYSIIEYSFLENNLINYFRFIYKDSYESEGNIYNLYKEFELTFNYDESYNVTATFKLNNYEYYLDSETNELATDKVAESQFIKLEGTCTRAQNVEFDTPKQGLVGIIERADLYNAKSYAANIEESKTNYLYSNTAVEAQLKVSNLQALINSEKEAIDLSKYETEVVDTTTIE